MPSNKPVNVDELPEDSDEYSLTEEEEAIAAKALKQVFDTHMESLASRMTAQQKEEALANPVKKEDLWDDEDDEEGEGN